jgi:hypothetical protein
MGDKEWGTMEKNSGTTDAVYPAAQSEGASTYRGLEIPRDAVRKHTHSLIWDNLNVCPGHRGNAEIRATKQGCEERGRQI